jgi:hypothetical protein
MEMLNEREACKLDESGINLAAEMGQETLTPVVELQLTALQQQFDAQVRILIIFNLVSANNVLDMDHFNFNNKSKGFTKFLIFLKLKRKSHNNTTIKVLCLCFCRI